jgi:ornithine--oxo-acid transaminase
MLSAYSFVSSPLSYSELSHLISRIFSAVNQGHCHPVIIEALCTQAQKLTLSSRAFYNSVFGRFAQAVTALFKYDMVLPMNTGAEAVETAIKLARKWAYMKKGVPAGKAIVLSVTENFHGRTMGVIRSVK